MALKCIKADFFERRMKGAQTVEFEAEARSWTIRNFSFMNLLYNPPIKSKGWKRLRLLVWINGIVLTLASVPALTAVAVLDPNKYSGTWVEWLVLAHAILFAVNVILLANVDVTVYSLQSYLALFDAINFVATILLLLIFGEGFFRYGAAGLSATYFSTYTWQSTEVYLRLNFARPVNYQKRGTLIIGIVMQVALRIMIFYKKFTVTDEIILGQIPFAQGDLTLQDLWEVFADLLIVRAFFLYLERLQQPYDTVSTFQNFPILKRHPSMTSMDFEE